MGISLARVLLVLLLARLFSPRRQVTAHWHSFLEPSPGFLGFISAYQWIALHFLPFLSGVLTTSPILAMELKRSGNSDEHVRVLSCCLSQQQEEAGLALPLPSPRMGSALNVVFIGRLDTYKRLDWLLSVLAKLESPWRLAVVGDGPKRAEFERLAYHLFPHKSPVAFLGRLSESCKLKQLALADVLVLPSDSSNEAFGIVQIEAMAAGRPALAFNLPRSGMSWVGQLPGLIWSQSPEGLLEVLQRLADQPQLRHRLGAQARERYLRLFSRAVWSEQLEQLGDLSIASNVVTRME